MKGVNFLIDQVPTHTWRVERKAKRVVGRAYATKLLWQMLECRPPPSTPENEFFQMFVYDQTYATAGGGHGVGSNSHNGVGRFDAEGKRIRTAGGHCEAGAQCEGARQAYQALPPQAARTA